MASGTALTVRGRSGYKQGDPDRTSGLEFMPVLHRAQGFKLTGSLDAPYTTDAVVISDPLNVAFISFENVFVYGFRDQFVLQDKTWCISWTLCFLRIARRYGLNIQAVVDAGENYHFFCGAIVDVKNAAGTGAAVYTTPESSADNYFHSTSFDYNDMVFDHNSGVMGLFGCHVEGSKELPFGRLSYTGGYETTTFQMVGGGLAATETNTIRPSLIDCVSGDQILVKLDAVKLNTISKNYQIVRTLAGNPTVRLADLHLAYVQRPATSANRLYNGGFDHGTTDGWVKAAVSGTTYTAQTTVKNGGTHALAIAGNGIAGTSSITQRFPVASGQTLIAEGFLANTGITAGTAFVQARFLAHDGALITASTLANVSSTSPAAFTPARVMARVPMGAVSFDVTIRTADLNGTLHADDFVVNIF